MGVARRRAVGRISVGPFWRDGRVGVFARAVDTGLLVREHGRLRFTAAGRLVADSVLSELV